MNNKLFERSKLSQNPYFINKLQKISIKDSDYGVYPLKQPSKFQVRLRVFKN